ncbi:hypothetical protein ACHAXR_006926, partial [Thalassiosira sp. AJA248-18]
KNQKQYDGPATANIDHNDWNPTPSNKNRLVATNVAAKYNNNDDRHRLSSSSNNNNDRRRRKTSSSSGGRRRPTSNNNTPLASGISSRRTTQIVRSHLPARVMSPVAEKGGQQQHHQQHYDHNNNGGGKGRVMNDEIPRTISLSNRSGDGGGGGSCGDISDDDNDNNNNNNNNNFPTTAASAAIAAAKKKEKKLQMPMDHDGGVLCLCAIPNNNSSDNTHSGRAALQTHRFLSGGADGTVKLWEVHETPMDDNHGGAGMKKKGGREMIPRLVRTYRGHSGYVHSIAVLGTLGGGGSGGGGGGDPSMYNDNSERSDSGGGSAARRAMPKRTSFSHLSIDSGGSNEMMKYLKKIATVTQNKLLLFVSASRDNTLRIWPIDDNNNNTTATNDHDAFFEDYETAGAAAASPKSPGNNNKKDIDPFARGMKLRGHQFGKNNIGGVLCVCAVPSLPTANAPSDYNGGDNMTNNGGGYDDNDDHYNNNNNNIEPSMDGTISAGQFCSGGSDGRIRVWDVRSALNLSLGKVPKSGMYGTVQLQCIDPPLLSGGGAAAAAAAAITSLECTHQGIKKEEMEVALFAGDASGTIRRYSRMNECGVGHINSAIWWTCTAVFAGHTHPITSMAMLSSPMLMPLLCPNEIDELVDKDVVGTMLVSSCNDGAICVWDAFDARIHSTPNHLDSSERGHVVGLDRNRAPQRSAMWEIELNDGEDTKGDGDCPLAHSRTDRPYARNLKHRIGVTSLTTLQAGTLMAAGTTDGAIRMWNVSSGLYEGAYNLGKSVQIWSLGMLSEQDVMEDYDEDGEGQIHTAGIIVSGDNRGRIRVLRKMSTRVSHTT